LSNVEYLETAKRLTDAQYLMLSSRHLSYKSRANNSCLVSFLCSLTVLEGIALASDRNYKVLGAAYPWIAKKVLTDRSPALRATLKELLYQVRGDGVSWRL
jgi:predicted unusual protein kinase regulating ubiquinone biosynthesis (AarF/ABC1/UbiB family)